MKIGLIGCGAMGEAHADAAIATGSKVTACFDEIATRARALAKRYKAACVADPFELISDSRIDAVVVATPTVSHAPYVIPALRAGKRVLSEAPLVRTKGDIARVRRAAGDGSKLFVNHPSLYDPAYRAIWEQVESNKVGVPGFIKIRRVCAPLKGAKGWYSDTFKSGGVVLDAMVHDFHWLIDRFGEPIRIFCQETTRKGARVSHHAMVTLVLEAGLIAQVVGVRTQNQCPHVLIEICGTGGMIQFDSREQPIAHYGKAGAECTDTNVDHCLENLWRDFSRDGDRGARASSVEPALSAVRAALDALRSSARRMPVKR